MVEGNDGQAAGQGQAFIRDEEIGCMDTAKYQAGRPQSGPVSASIISRKDVYELIGGFCPHSEWAADADWNLRAIAAGLSWGCIDKHYYGYRQHIKQMGKRAKGKQKATFEKLIGVNNA